MQSIELIRSMPQNGRVKPLRFPEITRLVGSECSPQAPR
jgi:hypothetical protein